MIRLQRFIPSSLEPVQYTPTTTVQGLDSTTPRRSPMKCSALLGHLDTYTRGAQPHTHDKGWWARWGGSWDRGVSRTSLASNLEMSRTRQYATVRPPASALPPARQHHLTLRISLAPGTPGRQ